ncbi:hypothetical protein [Lentibacillus salinarum]|uniref:hypothetical protein n=1 Tax=Lentibacillus salinarum TaxID=446820 RepID=UPI0036D39A0A
MIELEEKKIIRLRHKDVPYRRWSTFNKKHNNRFSFHYTPIHASWVNQVETFFLHSAQTLSEMEQFSFRGGIKRSCRGFHWVMESGRSSSINWTFGGYLMQHELKAAA